MGVVRRGEETCTGSVSPRPSGFGGSDQTTRALPNREELPRKFERNSHQSNEYCKSIHICVWRVANDEDGKEARETVQNSKAGNENETTKKCVMCVMIQNGVIAGERIEWEWGIAG